MQVAKTATPTGWAHDSSAAVRFRFRRDARNKQMQSASAPYGSAAALTRPMQHTLSNDEIITVPCKMCSGTYGSPYRGAYPSFRPWPTCVNKCYTVQSYTYGTSAAPVGGGPESPMRGEAGTRVLRRSTTCTWSSADDSHRDRICCCLRVQCRP